MYLDWPYDSICCLMDGQTTYRQGGMKGL